MKGLCECGCGQATRIAKATCRTQRRMKGQPYRFVNGHQNRGARRAALSPLWKGGRLVSPKGYVRIYAPEHPRSVGLYVFEHILIAERAMGKPLVLPAQVHHFDGDRSNNANGNLVVCQDTAYHRLLHQRQRALAACGDASARSCKYCHRYDRQSEMRIRKSEACHLDCERQLRPARGAR